MRSTRRLAQAALATAIILGSALPLAPRTAWPAPGFAPRPIESVRLDAAEAERLGWDPAGLDRALAYAATLSTDALVIATGGRNVATMGRLDEAHDVHSVRKAMLSALVGQHVGPGPGRISLDATLADLGVDDEAPPLTPLQRTATVRHLLGSVSGINHAAAAEGGLTADKSRRLGDRENVPGTVWAYNNWDYNALTSIFEQRTGLTIAEAFATGIAGPTGMQDVTGDTVSYLDAPGASRHRAAMFRMTARDLVRFGRLYLDSGRVGDTPVLPAAWVARISGTATPTGLGGLRAGHGDLWWVPGPETGLPAGSFLAWGLGQQMVLVVPAWDTVVVHQSDTARFVERWRDLQRQGVDGDAALERIVLGCFEPSAAATEFCREDRFTTGRELDRLVALIVAARHRDGG